MNNLFSLDNKIVLITGASRGIGFLLARGLAQQGAHILINATTEAHARHAAERLRDEGCVPMRRRSTSPTPRRYMPLSIVSKRKSAR
jgi:Dehydrogenases with different specificities (related to short-chain alcohol dehydrogenases)